MSIGNKIIANVGMTISQSAACVNLDIIHPMDLRIDSSLPSASGTNIARAIAQELLEVAYRVDLINNENKQGSNDN
jgi:hypothetical protein